MRLKQMDEYVFLLAAHLIATSKIKWRVGLLLQSALVALYSDNTHVSDHSLCSFFVVNHIETAKMTPKQYFDCFVRQISPLLFVPLIFVGKKD